MIQDGLSASHLSFKLPVGGFRVLAACSNSADLLPLCVLHWPLFSNFELAGTVWKQTKAFLLHYWDFPSSQTTYYSFGPWRARQIVGFKLMIWVRTKWDKSVSLASCLHCKAFLFVNVRCAGVCGRTTYSRLKPRFSACSSWVCTWVLCSLWSAVIPCRPFSPNLATWSRKRCV